MSRFGDRPRFLDFHCQNRGYRPNGSPKWHCPANGLGSLKGIGIVRFAPSILHFTVFILAHTRFRVDGVTRVLMRDLKTAVPRFRAL